MLIGPNRCFGDKGDVEDITEGMSQYLNTIRVGSTET
jgi:hypothetical protein